MSLIKASTHLPMFESRAVWPKGWPFPLYSTWPISSELLKGSVPNPPSGLGSPISPKKRLDELSGSETVLCRGPGCTDVSWVGAGGHWPCSVFLLQTKQLLWCLFCFWRFSHYRGSIDSRLINAAWMICDFRIRAFYLQAP